MKIFSGQPFTSERDLLNRLQQSSPTDPVWGYALKEYHRKTVRTVYKKYSGASEEEVEMAYEDAWMVMYHKLKEGKPVEEAFNLNKGTFSSYLIGATLNIYGQKQRKKKTLSDLTRLLADLPDVPSGEEPPIPLDQELPERCRKVFREAMESLPAACTTLIRLRYGEDLQWEAIGQALNAKHFNLQNRLTKCKKELRNKLVAARFHEECFNKF